MNGCGLCWFEFRFYCVFLFGWFRFVGNTIKMKNLYKWFKFLFAFALCVGCAFGYQYSCGLVAFTCAVGLFR